MKWKLYYWFLCLLALFSLAGIPYIPSEDLFPQVMHQIIFIGELVGLFAFIYKKNIGRRNFWKYFLWVNIVLDIFSIVNSLYPKSEYLQVFRILLGTADMDIGVMLVAVLMDIPLLYVMYRLSRGEFYNPGTDKTVFVSPGIPKWGLLQIACWGYSIVISGVFLLSSIYPPPSTSEVVISRDSDSVYGVLMMVPIILFWLFILFQQNLYKKNWWRMTLLANGLFISLLMISSMLFPAEDTVTEMSELYTLMGLLQFFILIIALYIYGREQFHGDSKKMRIPA